MRYLSVGYHHSCYCYSHLANNEILPAIQQIGLNISMGNGGRYSIEHRHERQKRFISFYRSDLKDMDEMVVVPPSSQPPPSVMTWANPLRRRSSPPFIVFISNRHHSIYFDDNCSAGNSKVSFRIAASVAMNLATLSNANYRRSKNLQDFNPIQHPLQNPQVPSNLQHVIICCRAGFFHPITDNNLT